MSASEPSNELCSEELDSLLRIFERSDEPETVKYVFSRLCLYFAWASQNFNEVVPTRDGNGAVRISECLAWFARIVALRMTGQDGDAEVLPSKPLQVAHPDQVLGWDNPPNRPPEPAYVHIERDVQMSACIALFERGDSERGKRGRAKKRVAKIFGCSVRRVEEAMRQCPSYLWVKKSTETLQEIRTNVEPFPFRR